MRARKQLETFFAKQACMLEAPPIAVQSASGEGQQPASCTAAQVYLETRVKVRKAWREDATALRDFGYL